MRVARTFAGVLLGCAIGGADARAADFPMRVVSLSPVASELLLGLGAADRLVAVDRMSQQRQALRQLPLAAAGSLAGYGPDLVVAPGRLVASIREEGLGAPVIEISPHDFDEAYAACREIGAALGLKQAAQRWILEVSRPLARLSAESFGERRPRVAVVSSLAPLRVAGGHSFATDLVELAGGESVGHGTHEPVLDWSPAQIAAAMPELIVIVSRVPPSPSEQARARSLLGQIARLEFLTFDPELFWLGGAEPVARRLRVWVESIAGAPGSP